MLIDSHAHLMFDHFESDLEEVLSRAEEAGVSMIVNVGCSIEGARQAVEMAGKYPQLYATMGLHPYDAEQATEELFAEWEKLILENDKIVAVGECGLDYVKGEADPEVQKRAFEMQLNLARRVGLPVIIHNRGADEDCLEILKKFNSEGQRVDAVFHCFSSDVSFARRVWHDGYLTSFTGNITYPQSKGLLEVVDEVPMDKFMVETDCPFLSPQEFRGQRNEPAYVAEVAKFIAEVKQITEEQVQRISTENALSFYLRMN